MRILPSQLIERRLSTLFHAGLMMEETLYNESKNTENLQGSSEDPANSLNQGKKLGV